MLCSLRVSLPFPNELKVTSTSAALTERSQNFLVLLILSSFKWWQITTCSWHYCLRKTKVFLSFFPQLHSNVAVYYNLSFPFLLLLLSSWKQILSSCLLFFVIISQLWIVSSGVLTNLVFSFQTTKRQLDEATWGVY